MHRFLPLFLIAAAVFAQPSPDSLAFEVATVKPSPPPDSGMMVVSIRGGPGTADPGQFTASGANLRMLLARAYNVKLFQISGPNWIDSERYDITAKVPSGATKDQFGVMLRNLLVERFKLKVHREKKEQPVYALVVAKNGPKLKESAPDSSDDDGKEPPPPPPGPPKIGKDGLPDLPPGRGQRVMMMNGRVRMGGHSVTMTQFANMLENQVGRPVIDETSLTGKYDISLDFAPDENMRGPLGRMGGPPPQPPPGAPPGAAPPGDPSTMPPNFGEGAPSVFAALQQLGLKLDAKKGPADLVIIDSGDKTPIEN